MIRIPVNITLTGDYASDIKKIQLTLAQIEEGLEPELERDLVEAAQFIKAMARIYVPKKTGSLEKSIRVEHISRLAVRVRAGGYVTNPDTGRLVDYAMYVEEGTSKMGARPFLRPAWENGKKFVETRVTESLMRLAQFVG